jgi:hypothetical protein
VICSSVVILNRSNWYKYLRFRLAMRSGWLIVFDTILSLVGCHFVGMLFCLFGYVLVRCVLVDKGF